MAKKLTIIFVLVISSYCLAGNWPQWRGPFFNGSCQESDLPRSWSIGDKTNILWVADLPGPAAATPVVYGNYVFVSSSQKKTSSLYAICLDVLNGKVLWQKHASTTDKRERSFNHASCSPVTDGNYAAFLFGTGDLICFDYQGREIWQRKLVQEFGYLSIKFGYHSSPLLYKGILYIVAMRNKKSYRHRGQATRPLQSYIMAVSIKTGKTLWRRIVTTDAIKESVESYTTALPLQVGNNTEIIFSGGDYITACGPYNGNTIWNFCYSPRHKNMWRLVSSPVVGKGVLYFSLPRGGNGLYALQIKSTKDNKPKPVKIWEFDGYTPDVCTPVLYRNRLYVLDGQHKKTITCLNAQTGQVVWCGKLPGHTVLRCSPLGADGKIYCIDETGEVFVVAAGDEFKLLADIKMKSRPCQSSIIAAHKCLFIRTADKLYCIGKANIPHAN